MNQPNAETFSCDIIYEFTDEGSQPIEPRQVVSPPLSPEKKAFLEAIDQFQRKYTGRSLSWGEIFDVLVSLGYRKVEPSAAPPESNGTPPDSARPDAAGNETPS